MATIHITRGTTSLGTFSEEEVREGLRTGRFASNDLGWKEGMATWEPLSKFSEFAGAAPPPAPTSTITPTVSGPTAAPRSGLPWERRRELGLVKAFTDTLLMVLTKPVEAFTVMRTEGGLGGPLAYAAIGGGIGVIVWFVLAVLFQSLGLFANREAAMSSMFGMTVSFMLFAWRLIFVLIAPFVFGGLTHLSLMLLGKAKNSFEATFRVVAFSQGSTMPLQLVPCCGGFAALIWWLVANCIGVARTHEIDTGYATLAVLLPFLICCGGCILALFMFGGLAALGHN